MQLSLRLTKNKLDHKKIVAMIIPLQVFTEWNVESMKHAVYENAQRYLNIRIKNNKERFPTQKIKKDFGNTQRIHNKLFFPRLNLS